MNIGLSWAVGLLGSLMIAGAAYRKRTLSFSGAAAAVFLGTVLYALGTMAWFGTLIAFFISSTLLTKWKRKAKQQAESRYEKTGARDAAQVAANGGIALLLCTANFIWPSTVWWTAFVGVMAAVNADTWATEIGGLSKSAPRSILTGKQVPAGTSGGITLLGFVATVLGGLFIGAIAWSLLQLSAHYAGAANIRITSFGGIANSLLVALAGGMAGSLSDSVIGAKWQAMYRCSICGKVVEQSRHCGNAAIRTRGLGKMNNDAVNFISSAIGGSAAVLLAGFLPVL